MNKYPRWNEYLGKKAERPLPGHKNTTRLRREGDDLVFRYHETDVVVLHPNGSAILDSGGWRTLNTKQRINEYGPARVFSENNLWFVQHDGQQALFEDGMTVDATGRPSRWKTMLKKMDKARKQKAKLDKLVRQYIDGYAEHFRDGLVEPSGGDCWGCYFQVQESGDVKREVGWPLGTPKRPEPMGYGHYFQHFSEKYYVPSLLINALKTKGYREPGVLWWMIDGDLKRGRSDMLKRELQGFFRKIKPDLLKEMG